MWKKIGVLALAASLAPLVACAQSNPGDGAGPSPEMRAKMDAARSDAKTGAFAALSDAHRGQVQAIVDKFDADGSTLTLTDAASQIDAVLTPDESTAVLAQRQKLRDAMRAAYAGSAPGGRGIGGGAAGGRGGRGLRSADAGRFVLQVDATPERFRDAMRAERGNG